MSEGNPLKADTNLRGMFLNWRVIKHHWEVIPVYGFIIAGFSLAGFYLTRLYFFHPNVEIKRGGGNPRSDKYRDKEYRLFGAISGYSDVHSQAPIYELTEEEKKNQKRTP